MPAFLLSLIPVLTALMPVIVEIFKELLNAPDTAEVAKPNVGLDALWNHGLYGDKASHSN